MSSRFLRKLSYWNFVTGSTACAASGSDEMIGSGVLREDLTLFRIGSGESGESLLIFAGEKIE